MEQLPECLEVGVEHPARQLPARADVRSGRDAAGRALLEASGRVTEENVRAIAETGVDLISSGWITHSAPALDIGLDFLD